jgi:hypothetical protein
MSKTPIETVCPFCKVGAGLPCESVEGHRMMGFHRQRLKKKERHDKNPVAAGIRTRYKLENIL